jgi:hypothetical protein
MKVYPLTVESMLDGLRITPEQVRRGCELYEQNEPRDSMYRVASFLLREDVWWGKYGEMADALTVLLLTWNIPFYRAGPFDAARLESSLREHWQTISDFHGREIGSLCEQDRGLLDALFLDIMDATQIVSGGARGRKSPVSAAKALHLLAPRFLPIWDSKIASAYGCGDYLSQPAAAYWRFCLIMRELVRRLEGNTTTSTKTLLKMIDQYNYARYTKAGSWVWES